MSLVTAGSLPTTPDASDAFVAFNATQAKNDTAPPSSPPLLPSGFPSLVHSKDRRAYEHERQKAKRSAELVKSKARKEASWRFPRLYYSSSARRGGGTPAVQKEVRMSDDDLATVVEVGPYGLFDNLKTSAELSDAAKADANTPVTEVKLLDLISSAKTRKSNKAGDFEVVPHIRSVIALDDVVTPSVAADEPWEYIQASEHEEGPVMNNAKGLTYANALLSTPK